MCRSSTDRWNLLDQSLCAATATTVICAGFQRQVCIAAKFPLVNFPAVMLVTRHSLKINSDFSSVCHCRCCCGCLFLPKLVAASLGIILYDALLLSFCFIFQ